MRICVVGAGAIGGFAGASLGLGGHDVTFIARGENRDAIRARGLRITYDDGRKATAHGGPDMPAWGDVFAKATESAGAENAAARIDVLVEYLQTLQVK